MTTLVLQPGSRGRICGISPRGRASDTAEGALAMQGTHSENCTAVAPSLHGRAGWPVLFLRRSVSRDENSCYNSKHMTTRAIAAMVVLLIALSVLVLGTLGGIGTPSASEHTPAASTSSARRAAFPKNFANHYYGGSTGASSPIGPSSRPMNSPSKVPAEAWMKYENEALGVYFTAAPVFGAAPLTSGFSLSDYRYQQHTDQSYVADFGDGTVEDMTYIAIVCGGGCSKLWSIQHTFAAPGSYYVTVYSSGTDSLSKKQVVATTTVVVSGRH